MSIASKKNLLAIQIIEENFGKITADVAKYIIRHENNSISEIIRYFTRQNQLSKSTIKAAQVRDSLLILLQQNCLILEPDTSVELIDGESTVFLYRIDLDMVINRLRFPKFLSTIENLYGDLAVKLIEELIFHGRLRFDQVVEDVQARQKDARAVALQQIDTSSIDVEDSSSLDPDVASQLPPINSRLDIEEMFEKLAENRFIVPAPSRSSYVASAETLRSEMIKKEKAVKTNKLMDGDGSGGGVLETLVRDSSATNGKVTVKRSRQVEAVTAEDSSMLPVELRAMMAHASQHDDGLLQQGVGEDETDAPPAKVAKVRGGRGRGGRGRGGGGRGGRGGAVGVAPTLEETKKSSGKQEGGEVAGMEVENGGGSDTSTGPRKDVLWMLGWTQLAEEERNALCISVTTQRMGTMGANVVELLLNDSEAGRGGSGGSNPAILMSVPDIHKGLREQQKKKMAAAAAKTENGVIPSSESIDLKTLSLLLETMRCDSTGVVDKVLCDDKNMSSRSPHYLVNKTAILQAVRRRLIHAIAEERFGYQSARIVELLQCKNYLEQQKISDMAILPAKEGRERLYDLYQNHWVDYMEVSKRGDFNPSNTYFFWTLSTEKLIDNLLNAQYGAVYNLRCRYLKEIADGKSLLDFSHKITDNEEAQKFDKLSESLDRLDNAVLKIMENITVLSIL